MFELLELILEYRPVPIFITRQVMEVIGPLSLLDRHERIAVVHHL